MSFLGFSVDHDAWLSGLLDKQVYTLSRAVNGQSLSDVLNHYLSRSHAFATLKLPADEVALSVKLQRVGFHHVETALSLYRPALSACELIPIVRPADSRDRQVVVSIARRSFLFSRFHLDPMISNECACTVKAEWVNNFFAGRRGDGLLVAEYQGNVSGFLQYIHANDGSLLIDLIAVAPEATRKQLGAAMLAYAANRGSDDGSPVALKVGTQACNIPAINLYIKMGFCMTGSQHVFHYHSRLMHEKSLGSSS